MPTLIRRLWTHRTPRLRSNCRFEWDILTVGIGCEIVASKVRTDSSVMSYVSSGTRCYGFERLIATLSRIRGCIVHAHGRGMFFANSPKTCALENSHRKRRGERDRTPQRSNATECFGSSCGTGTYRQTNLNRLKSTISPVFSTNFWVQERAL